MKFKPRRAKGGDRLEPGSYLVRISNIEFRTAAGKPCVDFTFKDEITDGTLRETFWLTDAARFRIEDLGAVCGFKDEFEPQDLIGCRLHIKVAKKAGKKDGKMYSVLQSSWELTEEEEKGGPLPDLPNREPGQDEDLDFGLGKEEPF
jgi:hypothetical protein